MLGANLILWAILLAPPVVIGTLSGAKELGLAQTGYGVIGNVLFIATVFQRVGLPSFSRFKDEPERFNNAVAHVLRLLSIVFIPLTMGIASFSPLWVPFIYGSDWQAMDKVVLLAALPITLSAFFAVYVSVFYSKGLSMVVLGYNALHAFIFWAVMFLLAGPLGALSMPLAHLAAMGAAYFFVRAYKKECGHIDYRGHISGFLVGAFVMFASFGLLINTGPFIPAILWAVFIAGMAFYPEPHRKTLGFFLREIWGSVK